MRRMRPLPRRPIPPKADLASDDVTGERISELREVKLNVNEDIYLNALADERADGPFVQVRLENL